MKTHRYILHLLISTLLAWLTVCPAFAGGVTLVPMRSVWKYLDNGTYPGATWTSPFFNDSGWASGRAELGYGDGGEATVVGYGPDPGNKYITTYFRHAFVVTNAAAYSNLTLRLLRDDGAVVYLNGIEIARVGMPAGLVDFQTRASSAGDYNVLFVCSLVYLNSGTLVNGTNVLVVEIHQASPVSTDISFDLELADEPVNVIQIIDLATTNAAFACPANLSLTTKVASQEGVTKVDFYMNGTIQSNQSQSMNNNLYASFDCAFAAPTNCSLAVTATDKRGVARTSAVDVVVESIPSSVPTVSLVPTGSDWKYLDDGADQGTAWQFPNYSDTAWPSGPAVLGHNRLGIATTTQSGIMTTYFRHTFEVPSPSLFSKLALRVLRDDGVKVHLNGSDVFRNNLPTDPVTASTKALEEMDTTNFLSSAYVDPSLLVTGRNVLAVEMHQTATNATRLAFDLELTGITAPRLSLRLAGPNNALITWPYPSTGFRLLETPSLSQPTWTYVTNPLPVQVGDDNQVPVAPPTDNRYYQLRRD